MNESLDLRKRILKMREDNNFILSNVKSENIKEVITKEFKAEDFKLEKKEIFSSINTKKLVEDENAKKQILTKNDTLSHVQTLSHDTNKQNSKNLVRTNEVQFRILADKFNEAVEVILELSEKVKKLEHTVYKNHKETIKGDSFFSNINIKIVFILILIPLLILGVFTLPFNLITMKLILSDIISSM